LIIDRTKDVAVYLVLNGADGLPIAGSFFVISAFYDEADRIPRGAR
jgi:hypothetical protein